MSTKIELRQKFAEISGRHDLVTDFAAGTYTDNGADFFLKAGQRELDRMYNFPKNVGRIWDTVASGTYFMKMQGCRAIQNVWVNNSSGRKELHKTPYIDLKNDYSSILSDITSNDPLWYAPAFIRAIPSVKFDGVPTTLAFVDGGAGTDSITDSANGFVADGFVAGMKIRVTGATTLANDTTYTAVTVAAGTITLATGSVDNAETGAAGMTMVSADENVTATFVNYIVGDSDSYNAIIFLPPPDETFDVEVKGLFYTDWPFSEGQTSYWMEIHPMVSVWAGLYMLEISYRNTAGANDWLTAIDRSVVGIDKDTVEEELSQDTTLQMEG